MRAPPPLPRTSLWFSPTRRSSSRKRSSRSSRSSKRPEQPATHRRSCAHHKRDLTRVADRRSAAEAATAQQHEGSFLDACVFACSGTRAVVGEGGSSLSSG